MGNKENVLKLVGNLANLRKIPQLLFVENIFYQSVITVREKIIDFKAKHPETNEIDFVIQSAGGIPSDAYRIVRTLRDNFDGGVNIILPFWCKSAATLIALGGSKIITDSFGELGAIDVQVAKEMEDRPDFDRESALVDEASLKRIETHATEMYYNLFTGIYENEDIPIQKTEISKQVFEFLANFYTPLLGQINPYRLGEKKRKLDIGEKYAERILLTYQPQLSKEKRTTLVNFLINECPEHGYVIDYILQKGFLGDIVIKSEEISKEYKDDLEKLSVLFLKNTEELSIIDFVLIEEPKTTDNHTPPVGQNGDPHKSITEPKLKS